MTDIFIFNKPDYSGNNTDDIDSSKCDEGCIVFFIIFSLLLSMCCICFVTKKYCYKNKKKEVETQHLIENPNIKVNIYSEYQKDLRNFE